MKKIKIVFSGGGTLGPVTPLLAMKEIFEKNHPQAEFFWIGTKRGPEKKLVEAQGIQFLSLSSGKFRRYISLWNIVDIIRIIIGFFQSLVYLWRKNPDICITAGGFISVPLHYAAWFLGVPTWVHQQDVRVGLANKLMARKATLVTTALEKSVRHFSKRKTVWLGNPVRLDLFTGSREKAQKLFHLKKGLPVVFVTGGGTGSMKVNTMVTMAVQHLQGVCQIIHLTGKERPQELIAPVERQFSDYYQAHQFFTQEMKHAYAIADIVISRAGFGTITEMAALNKAAILIPKPGHQDENANILEQAQAVKVLDEKTHNGNNLAMVIKELFSEKKERENMAKRLHDLLPPAKSERVNELLLKVLE